MTLQPNQLPDRHIHGSSQASSVTIGEFQPLRPPNEFFPLLRFKTEWSAWLTPFTLSSRDGWLQSSAKSYWDFLLSFVLPGKPMHVLMMLSPMLRSWSMTSMLCIRINISMYGSSHSAHLWVQWCVSPYPSKYQGPLRSGVSLSSISTICAPLRHFNSPFIIVVSFRNVFCSCLKLCFQGIRRLWQSK
jgi:hypothetical protein